MALVDRQYIRDNPPRRNRAAALFAAAPVTACLIVLNVAVYLLDQLLSSPGWVYRAVAPDGLRLTLSPLHFWGHFSVGFTVMEFQLWRLITFQFLHANLAHLLFNMLSLYIFGPMVERHLGSARFVRFYLICGVGGAVAYFALFMKDVLIGSQWVPLVGASAGIFGVLVAAAQVAPHAVVMMLFPPIPMRLRTLAWVFIGIAIYTILTGGRNAGGEAAHLGGAIIGFLLMQGERLMEDRFPVRPRGTGPWGDAQ